MTHIRTYTLKRSLDLPAEFPEEYEPAGPDRDPLPGWALIDSFGQIVDVLEEWDTTSGAETWAVKAITADGARPVSDWREVSPGLSQVDVTFDGNLS